MQMYGIRNVKMFLFRSRFRRGRGRTSISPVGRSIVYLAGPLPGILFLPLMVRRAGSGSNNSGWCQLAAGDGYCSTPLEPVCDHALDGRFDQCTLDVFQPARAFLEFGGAVIWDRFDVPVAYFSGSRLSCHCHSRLVFRYDHLPIVPPKLFARLRDRAYRNPRV